MFPSKVVIIPIRLLLRKRSTVKNKGVQPQSMELQWYLAGPALWSDGIRAVGLWSLTLALFLLIFRFSTYTVKTYVARFMGKGAILLGKVG